VATTRQMSRQAGARRACSCVRIVPSAVHDVDRKTLDFHRLPGSRKRMNFRNVVLKLVKLENGKKKLALKVNIPWEGSVIQKPW